MVDVRERLPTMLCFWTWAFERAINSDLNKARRSLNRWVSILMLSVALALIGSHGP